MYGVTDLKKGTLVQLGGAPFKVVEYAQKQMGRGGSIVNVKLKNLLDGSVLPKTFKGQDKIEPAEVVNNKLQYLYKDSKGLHFMDEGTYEQMEISQDVAGSGISYMKEGSVVDVQSFNGQVINIDLPVKVPLTVISTPNVVKGDTQSTVMKTAELETGVEIQVPIFIKQGDNIIVDTRSGNYVERQKLR